MNWSVQEHEKYTEWFVALEDDLQDAILAKVVGLLQKLGPALSRPHVDTIRSSQYPNMKELRVQYCGEPWRILFAFDPKRSAILLLGGNKVGDSEGWYKRNVPIADKRFGEHLEKLKSKKEDVENDDNRRKNGTTNPG